jgi:hypothetical protein
MHQGAHCDRNPNAISTSKVVVLAVRHQREEDYH